MSPVDPTVSGLFVHPVKSMAGRRLETAEVHPRGLVDDRSWMVCDADGGMQTARTLPRLLSLTADTPTTDPSVTGALRLRAPGKPDRLVHVPDGPEIQVTLFGDRLNGMPADAATQEWVREALGRPDVQLVWNPHPESRVLDPQYSRPGDHTAFADAYPVTVVSEESLTQLNDWIVAGALERGEESPAALTMERFRPNIVLRGAGAFAEDGWHRIGIGDVVLRLVKPSPRCVLTTVDPETLAKGKEPIRTLARHRRHAGVNGVIFAVNAIPESPGRLSLGDAVRVLD